VGRGLAKRLDSYLASGAPIGGGRPAGFVHEALLYRDDAAFLASTLPFVRDGLEQDDLVAVVESRRQTGLLAGELGPDAAGVRFSDIGTVGLNPARVIPAWQLLLDEARAAGRHLRVVGQPLWGGRGDAERAECHRHESLLNTVFDGAEDWWLLCPYDAAALSPFALQQAAESHPLLCDGGRHRLSGAFVEGFDVFGGALTDAPGDGLDLEFDESGMVAVRRAAGSIASKAGVAPQRCADFVLAVHELAANSLVHGGGRGLASFWCESGGVVGEVRDTGIIEEPLAGRVAPDVSAACGRGLWLVNQLCDLVQIRSSAEGSVVRVRMASERGA